MGLKENKVTEVQYLLDLGLTPYKVTARSGVHINTIKSMIKDGRVEIYTPYDEYKDDHLNSYINFEWLWEEDKLDEIAAASIVGNYVISKKLDEDEKAVSLYCKKAYGSIVGYLRKKHHEVLVDNILKECNKCNKLLSISNFSNNGRGYYGVMSLCGRCESKRSYDCVKSDPAALKVRASNRRTLIRRLPSDLSSEEWGKSLEKFERNCALCEENQVLHLDHYIPVSWGHGGTHFSNCIPLCRRCNLDKRDKQLPSSPERDRIEAYLASIIGCSPQTFRKYVDWCDANRRKPDEIKAGKTSFELFAESEAEVITIE